MAQIPFDDTQSDQSAFLCDYAFHGNAHGAVFFIKDDLPDLPHDPVNEERIDFELTRLDNARQKSLEQFKAIVTEAKEHLPEEFADGQETMFGLLYPTMIKKIIRLAHNEIENNQQHAETAVQLATEKIIKEMQDNKDSKNHAKMDDFRAIGNRVIRNILDLPHPSLEDMEEGQVVVADRLSPAQAIHFYAKKPAGIVLAEGSSSGHVGDLCEALGIPCAFLPQDGRQAFNILSLRKGQTILLNGFDNLVYAQPTNKQISAADKQKEVMRARREALAPLAKLPAQLKAPEGKAQKDMPITKVGGTMNVTSDAKALQAAGVDAIFLHRTEGGLASGEIPDEDTQTQIYTRAQALSREIPFTTRTYDIIADKARGTNFSLEDRLAITKTQMRAMIRANGRIHENLAEGEENPLTIMVPSLRLYDEVMMYREIFEQARSEVKKEGRAIAPLSPKFAIMVESPSVATPLQIYKGIVDSVSFGTNDLPANFVGVERNNPNDQYYLDLLHTEHIYMFEKAFAKAEESGIPFSICGRGAADPTLAPMFSAMGVKAFSTPHRWVLEVKNAIRSISPDDSAEYLQGLINAKTLKERHAFRDTFCAERGIGRLSVLQTDPHAPHPAQ